MVHVASYEESQHKAAQCYLGWKVRKDAPGSVARAGPKLPTLAVPSPGKRSLSCVPTPGATAPGTCLLVPSRVVDNDVDLPMIDQICRSSFREHKALQRWQHRALAAHRRAWDKTGRQNARGRAQLWQLQRTNGLVEEEVPVVRKEQEEEGESLSPAVSFVPIQDEGVVAPVPRMESLPTRSKDSKRKMRASFVKQERLRHLLRRRQEKRSERVAAAQAKVQALDADERAMLQEIFDLNASTKDHLMGLEVHRAVLEAGLVGHTAPERRAVAWTCRPPGQWEEDGLCFAEFAGKIVPSCRQTLVSLRQDKMQKALTLAPREWTGRVQRSRLLEAARLVLPADFPEMGEDYEDSAPEAQAAYETVRQYADGEGSTISDIVMKMQSLSEEWYRGLAAQRRTIQKAWALNEETFLAAGADLPHLDAIFRRVDVKERGFIHRDEVEAIFDELGVVPVSLMQKRKTLGFLNEQSGYDFPSFVKLVDRIRWLIISQEDRQLHSSFARLAMASARSVHAATRRAMRRIKLSTWAKCLDDADGGSEQQSSLEKAVLEEADLQENDESQQIITYDQLLALLTEAAVIPEGANSTFRRRRLVGREVMAAAKAMACLERIMQDVDPAARQLFTYQEMRLVLQRMREEARQEARLVEAKHIKELGLNLDQVQELRELFKRLDPHGTGLLTEVQVELALRALGVEMPHEACAAVAFRVFDFDLSGSIDFLEFLHMIVMAKGQEGPFKSPEDQKVTSLAKLERCDLLYLMNAMRVPLARADGMADTRLISEVSELLDIGSEKELQPIIGGGSLCVLVRYAERRATL